MSIKQLTARTTAQVRCWIETTEHHIIEDQNTHTVLTGHHHRLRIPKYLWEECHIRSGGEFDRRMYRWDHRAEQRVRDDVVLFSAKLETQE